MSSPMDDISSATFVWDDNSSYSSDDCVTITLSQDTIDSMNTSLVLPPITMASSTATSNVTISSGISHSTITNGQYTTIGAVGSNGNLGIGTSSNWNGTFSFNQPKLSIDADSEGVVFKTEKHSVNWDELIDDIKSIKRAFMIMSNNDELMKKYPEINDMLSDWLIRGLSK